MAREQHLWQHCRSIGDNHRMTPEPKRVPWASGPGEILRHALELLRNDSDTNRRLAMISIDNAVELMIKTYLGLPKRITALTIARKELQEASESFPALLDALERHAADKLDGVDLGAIEWYHRLRNELYHQGNGLTVERDKVEVYAELANILFRNLFGFDLVPSPTKGTEVLGDFMTEWGRFERAARDAAFAAGTEHAVLAGRPFVSFNSSIRYLLRAGLLTNAEISELEELRSIRNLAAHGQPDWEQKLTREKVNRLRELVQKASAKPPAA